MGSLRVPLCQVSLNFCHAIPTSHLKESGPVQKRLEYLSIAITEISISQSSCIFFGDCYERIHLIFEICPFWIFLQTAQHPAPHIGHHVIHHTRGHMESYKANCLIVPRYAVANNIF